MIKENSKGPVNTFTKAPRVIKVLEPATDPDLRSPLSEAKMAVFSSFIDKRGVHFDK